MGMRLPLRHTYVLLVLVLMPGCASQRVVPDELKPLVDRAVTFREVVAAPESHEGRILVLGGEVLKVKRLKNGTQIEFLQLPLDKNERPILNRQRSDGRFFAIQKEFFDPATIAEGTMMTIVGEVFKAKTDYLDDVEYRYPVVIVKHLHIWQEEPPDYVRPWPGFSFSIFGGTGFGGGRGMFGLGF
ncbi:MAG: Slp family lipoprotein [Nitrospira sp.]|nr:Slp family lipoprotein [Nitrospira sp.]